MALRCLIVDDSAPFLNVARALLEREGLTIVGVASTIAAGVEQAAKLQPDVTLVDIELGGESGFDLTERLAGNGRQASRVILISTHAECDFADLIAASAAEGFLSKSELSADAIRRLLGIDGAS